MGILVLAGSSSSSGRAQLGGDVPLFPWVIQSLAGSRLRLETAPRVERGELLLLVSSTAVTALRLERHLLDGNEAVLGPRVGAQPDGAVHRVLELAAHGVAIAEEAHGDGVCICNKCVKGTR